MYVSSIALFRAADGARVAAPTLLAKLSSSVRHGVHYVASHTGLPIVVVVAIALVISWNVFRRSARFVVEFVIALVVVLFATKMGWISW